MRCSGNFFIFTYSKVQYLLHDHVLARASCCSLFALALRSHEHPDTRASWPARGHTQDNVRHIRIKDLIKNIN